MAKKRNRKLDVNFNIGKRIKHVRHCIGWTQAELATRCHEQSANVAAWEAGFVEPGFYAVVKVADAFGLSLDQLIGRKPIDYFTLSMYQ